MTYPTLASNGTIGTLKLKNRIIKSALLENMADKGLPTAQTTALYRGFARGGAGLIITGHCYINEAGQANLKQHGAHTDEAVHAWGPIIDTVHESGAKIAMQLSHCGRQGTFHHEDGSPRLAPSAALARLYRVRDLPSSNIPSVKAAKPLK